MPKRHSHRHRGHSRRAMTSIHHVRRGLMSNRFWDTLSWVATAAGVVSSTIKGDVQYAQSQGTWQTKTLSQKLSFSASKLVSRFTNGAVILDPSAGPSAPTWNVANVLTNPLTWAGIGAEIYKRIPGLPQRTKVGKFNKLAIAGLASLLDDPSNQAVNRSSSYVTNGPQTRAFASTGINR
jgi:hypothetical protein